MHYSILFMLLLILVFGAVQGVWIGYFLRIPRGAGVLLALIDDTLMVCWLFTSEVNGSQMANTFYGDESLLGLFAISIVVNFGIAVLVKLYRAAIMDRMSDDERRSGAAGLKAWLSPVNILTIVFLAISVAYIFQDYGLATFIIGLCALLAYPLIKTLFQPASELPPPPPEASGDERQRVLALLEGGKITAEEAADLLSALAQSPAASTDSASPINGPRRVMMVGAAVSLLGFFLPWFSLHINQAINSVQQSLPQFPSFPHPAMPNDTVVTIHGGDVSHGIGWIILAIALGAAGLPLLWPARGNEASQQRKIIFIALLIGSIAIGYLLSGSFTSYISIEAGLVLTMVGYVFLWIGAVREQLRHRESVIKGGVSTSLGT